MLWTFASLPQLLLPAWSTQTCRFTAGSICTRSHLTWDHTMIRSRMRYTHASTPRTSAGTSFHITSRTICRTTCSHTERGSKVIHTCRTQHSSGCTFTVQSYLDSSTLLVNRLQAHHKQLLTQTHWEASTMLAQRSAQKTREDGEWVAHIAQIATHHLHPTPDSSLSISRTTQPTTAHSGVGR